MGDRPSRRVTSYEGPPLPDGFLEKFDAYCDEHDIKDGEYAAAFAAFLHEWNGWDGHMEPLPNGEGFRLRDG